MFVCHSYFTNVMPRGLDSVPNTMKLLVGVIVESSIVLIGTIVVLRRPHQPPHSAHICAVEPLKAASGSKVEILPSSQKSYLAERESWNSSSKISRGHKKCPQFLKLSPEQLDRLFFVVTVVGNTIFLSVLLLQSV